MQSERLRVKDGASHEADVVLESGPRTSRPVSKAVLELVSTMFLAGYAHFLDLERLIRHNDPSSIDTADG